MSLKAKLRERENRDRKNVVSYESTSVSLLHAIKCIWNIYIASRAFRHCTIIEQEEMLIRRFCHRAVLAVE
jgi:hypothetical protein